MVQGGLGSLQGQLDHRHLGHRAVQGGQGDPLDRLNLPALGALVDQLGLRRPEDRRVRHLLFHPLRLWDPEGRRVPCPRLRPRQGRYTPPSRSAADRSGRSFSLLPQYQNRNSDRRAESERLGRRRLGPVSRCSGCKLPTMLTLMCASANPKSRRSGLQRSASRRSHTDRACRMAVSAALLPPRVAAAAHVEPTPHTNRPKPRGGKN